MFKVKELKVIHWHGLWRQNKKIDDDWWFLHNLLVFAMTPTQNTSKSAKQGMHEYQWYRINKNKAHRVACQCCCDHSQWLQQMISTLRRNQPHHMKTHSIKSMAIWTDSVATSSCGNSMNTMMKKRKIKSLSNFCNICIPSQFIVLLFSLGCWHNHFQYADMLVNMWPINQCHDDAMIVLCVILLFTSNFQFIAKKHRGQKGHFYFLRAVNLARNKTQQQPWCMVVWCFMWWKLLKFQIDVLMCWSRGEGRGEKGDLALSTEDGSPKHFYVLKCKHFFVLKYAKYWLWLFVASKIIAFVLQCSCFVCVNLFFV